MPRPARQPQVAAPTADQSATIEALTKQLAEVQHALDQERRARLAPVSRNAGRIDSGDLKVGAGDGDVHMDTAGSPSLIRPDVEIVDGPASLALIDELAFNEELVEVMVLEQNSQYREPCISTWNDGRHQLFIRGIKQTVKRKFLEVLARSKPIKYGNVEFVDSEGNRRVKWPKHTASGYPFTVVRDDNPRGRDWLRKVMAQP